MKITVGELKEKIKNLDDSTEIFYQRIEDVYFQKHGWTPDLLVDDIEGPKDIGKDEYIQVNNILVQDGKLLFTGHF